MNFQGGKEEENLPKNHQKYQSGSRTGKKFKIEKHT